MNAHQVLFLTDNCDTAALWVSSVCQSQKKYAVTIAHQRSISTQAVTNSGLIIIEVESTKPVNALRLCQLLRSRTETPILFLSSLDDEEYEVEVYKAGADDYLLKPISPDLLHAKLRAWQRWVAPVPTWSWPLTKIGSCPKL